MTMTGTTNRLDALDGALRHISPVCCEGMLEQALQTLKPPAPNLAGATNRLDALHGALRRIRRAL